MEEEPPINDRELEKRAAYDNEAREELRGAVETTAKYQAERIIVLRKLSIDKLKELTDAGMTAFDHALNLYLKSGMLMEDTNFSLYFGWHARQAIVARLDQK